MSLKRLSQQSPLYDNLERGGDKSYKNFLEDRINELTKIRDVWFIGIGEVSLN